MYLICASPSCEPLSQALMPCSHGGFFHTEIRVLFVLKNPHKIRTDISDMSPNSMWISCYFFQHGICVLFVLKSAMGMEPKGVTWLVYSRYKQVSPPFPQSELQGYVNRGRKSTAGPQNKICTQKSGAQVGVDFLLPRVKKTLLIWPLWAYPIELSCSCSFIYSLSSNCGFTAPHEWPIKVFSRF